MAGTVAGGKAAYKTNTKRYGADFMARIGGIGGANGHTGGFAKPIACSCDLIDEPHYKKNCAGKKGGTTSRRYK